MFLPSIVPIINYYFEFINPSWYSIANDNLAKCFWRDTENNSLTKNKIRRFFPTNNKLLKNTNEATRTMTKRHKKFNWDLLSNLCCYLAPKKNWRKPKFGTDSFDICSDYGVSSCATPNEIDFIPGTYKHLTGVTINEISEGLKDTGCASVSWIFQDDKKVNIELIIEQVIHIPCLPIRLILPQHVENKQYTLVILCMQKIMKLI